MQTEGRDSGGFPGKVRAGVLPEVRSGEKDKMPLPLAFRHKSSTFASENNLRIEL